MSMYRKKRKCDGVWVWYVQYFDPAGKRRTEQAGTTRDAAVRLYGQRLEEVRNGKWEAPEVRRRQAQMEAIKRVVPDWLEWIVCAPFCVPGIQYPNGGDRPDGFGSFPWFEKRKWILIIYLIHMAKRSSHIG